MGTLSNLIEYQPFSMLPPGALPNAYTEVTFRPTTMPYAQPTHGQYGGIPGPFTVGGVYEINGKEFLAGFQPYWESNVNFTTVPQAPISRGTDVPQERSHLLYSQPNDGVYLQNLYTKSGKAFAGQAPNQGVYTGFGMTGDDGSQGLYGGW